jgi:hypothetical protein
VHVLVAGKDCQGAADAAAKLDGVSKVLHAEDANTLTTGWPSRWQHWSSR